MFRGTTALLGGGLPVLAAAALLQQRKDKKTERKPHRPLTWKREMHPCYNLSVKVLRAKNIHGTDLLSKADCYVELRLPTASPVTSRTQVIYNSSDPEWNETFYYHVHGAVKNILELTLYDKDVLLDDKLSSEMFDVGRIKAGKPWTRTFQLNPKNNAELEVEFFIEKSPLGLLRGTIILQGAYRGSVLETFYHHLHQSPACKIVPLRRTQSIKWQCATSEQL